LFYGELHFWTFPSIDWRDSPIIIPFSDRNFTFLSFDNAFVDLLRAAGVGAVANQPLIPDDAQIPEDIRKATEEFAKVISGALKKQGLI
jgi:hypothetical protein